MKTFLPNSRIFAIVLMIVTVCKKLTAIVTTIFSVKNHMGSFADKELFSFTPGIANTITNNISDDAKRSIASFSFKTTTHHLKMNCFMKTLVFTFKRPTIALIVLMTMVTFFGTHANAQVLGVFEFSGTQAVGCPTGTVTTQPANASFGTGNAFTSQNVTCSSSGFADTYRTSGWNTGGAINLNEYHQFTITPNAGFTLTLTNFSFLHLNTNTMNWFVRSSVDGFASNIGSGTSSTSAATPSFALPGGYTGLGATTFRIYITNADNANDVLRIDNVTLSGTVVCSTPPAVPTGAVNGSRCGTGTVSLSVAAPGAGLTIDWYANASGGSVLTGGTGTTSFTTPSISTTTTYYAQTRNTSTGCVSGTRTAVIATVNPIPATPGTITGSACVVANTANNIYSISGVPGATSYNWTVTGTGWSIPVSSTTTSVNITTGSSSGTVSVTATNACGTSSASSLTTSISTVNNIGFNGNINTNTLTICDGGTGNTINGGDAGSGPNYQWEVSIAGPTTGFGDAQSDNGSDDNEDYTIDNNYYDNPGTYYFRRVSSGSGCNGNSDVVVLTVLALPNLYNVSGSASFCTQGSVNITLSDSETGITYQLRNNAGDANVGSPVPGTGNSISFPTGTLTSTTTFNVLAYYSPSSCPREMTNTATVTIIPAIANNTVSSAQTICSGVVPAALTGSLPSGGNTPYFFSWESSTTGAGSGFGNASGTRTNQNYTPLAALTQTTWYRRTVTTNTGECTNTSPAIEITVNPLPAQVLVSGGGVFCNSATLTASNGGDGTIYFQGTTSGGTSTATTSPTALVSSSGTYYFRARSSAGCWGPQGSAVVTINPIPSSVTALPASAIICSGGSTNLTGSATINSTSVLTLLNDNFDSPTFTSVTSGTPTGNRTQAWAPEVSGTNVNSIATFTSPNGGNMMVATCGASSFLSTSSLNTSLTSQSISINAVTSLTLTFRHTFGVNLGSDVGTIVISTDNGSNWSSPVATYNANVGTSTSFQTVNIPLNSYVGSSNILIRFNFATSNAFGTSSWWAIDDVQLTGSAPNSPLFSWTANPPATGGLPPNAGTFLAANSSISVNPTETTTYTLTAKDPITICEATATSTATVTVNKAPEFTTCPANIAVNNDAGQCNAVVVYAAATTGTPAPVVSYAFAGATSGSGSGTGSGSAFNVGVTNVTITATNSCSPAAECTFIVTVTDDENPVIICDADITVNNDINQCGKTFVLNPPATDDNCAVATTIGIRSDAPLTLGDPYPVGTTTVNWTVTDIHGKTATCNQTVTVIDNQIPTITCPIAFTTVTDPASAYATIDLQMGPQPIVADNCGIATVIVTGVPALNHFPIGMTVVTWTVTDVNGKINSCTQTIVVNDIIDPDIDCNDPITINNTTGNCDGVTPVTYPAASDNSGFVTVSSDYTGVSGNPGLPPSVNPVTPLFIPTVVFPLGPTTIIWTATDPTGNDSWCPQLVTVIDNEPPSITCSGDVNRFSDPGLCTAEITLIPPVTSDNCAGVLNLSNDHPSNVFNLGETIVTWTVTDASGNSSICPQKVNVTDNQNPTIIAPGNVTVSSDAGICTASGVTLGTPTTADNCSVASVTNDATEPYALGATTVTWTVTDGSGNQATATQTVTVTDNQNPTIIAPAAISVSSDAGICTASGVALGTAITADNCNVASVTNNSSQPFALGNTIVTWTVIDGSGNEATATQTITVIDNQFPTISVPANVTVSSDLGICTASGVALGTATTADNCSVASVTNDAMEPYALGTTIVTWTVTDGSGNKTTATQTVTVTDDQDPTITAPDNVFVNSDAGICSASGVNLGTAIIADNCSIASVTNNATEPFALGTTIVTWTITDGSGNTSEATQTVTVTDNEQPIITCPSDVTVNCQDDNTSAATGLATATDNCTSVANIIITESSVSTQDANVANASYYNYTITRTWRATDVKGNYSECDQIITVGDITLPVINCPEDVTVNCQDDNTSAATGIATATDNCTPNANISITESDVSTQDLNVNNAAHYNYTITRTWGATDVSGNYSECVQTITVQDITNPVITCPEDVTVNCQDDNSSPETGVATGTDNCSPVTIMESNVSTQNASLTNAGHYNYTITRTWRATDVSGNYSECIQTITVQDITNPVITCPEDVTVNCQDDNSSPETGVATGTDNCSPPVTITESNVSTQNASLTNAGHYNYTITRTWGATDVSGNYSECVQTITVQDITNPVITCPEDVTLNCQDDNSSPETGVATSTDNCSPVTITESNVSTQNASLTNAGHYNYTITRTWRATDVSGNYSECEQSITVRDVTAPTFSRPADITIYTNATCTYNADVNITGDVTNEADNCSPGLQAVSNDVITNGACAGSKIITRTWSLVDISGNAAATQVQVITVIDTTAPTWIMEPSDLTVECDGVGNTVALNAWLTNHGGATATDSCSGVTWSHNFTELSDLCGATGSATVTFTASDACGNASTSIATFTISDTVKPIISGCPANIILTACTPTATWVEPTANDICAGAITVVRTGPAPDSTFANDTTTTITYTATDPCGNASTCSFTVTRRPELKLEVSNSNPQLYFGYSFDQSTIIKGTPSGGVGPYKVEITMSRILGCNVVSSTGDEKWVPSGGTSTGNTCPSSGPGSIPVSTAVGVTTNYSVTATLMADAVITVKVTDANGCTITKTTQVFAEDARCFAGNSGNAKIKICHRTDSSKNPCHEICVAESAVEAHLAHGDYLGSCLPNCATPPVLPASISRKVETEINLSLFEVVAYPNPTANIFNIDIESDSSEKIGVIVFDVLGREVIRFEKKYGQPIIFGENLPSGAYILVVSQESSRKTINLIKR